MCCLFGMVDYGHTLTWKQKRCLLNALAVASEARGVDATGIAYNSNEQMRVYKRPWPARRMRFFLPADAYVVMGHTRMTTQGSERKNYNNHPFEGVVNGTAFALAHNGMLFNDSQLRRAANLPKTKIETDSYVAVQLIERRGQLNFDSLRYMAEQIEGTFSFTVLDGQNDLYFVKGNNPLCLVHFPKLKLYLYASTEDILKRAIYQTWLAGEPMDRVGMSQGDILKIDALGKQSKEFFQMKEDFYAPCWGFHSLFYPQSQHKGEDPYVEELKAMAGAFGYLPEDIDRLLQNGFTPEDIEEFFYGHEI